MSIISENLLVYILMFPIIGVLLLCFIPAREKTLLKFIALNAAFLPFLGSLLLWGAFDKSTGVFQFVSQFSWFPILNLNFSLGIDGISLFFLLLTTLLIPLGRILGFFRTLQGRMYWNTVIRLTQIKSLFNCGESGDSWMINDVICLSIKGLRR